MRYRTNRANSAFTLIELLVVIAIIAILAAILFPVFAQAREKARAASCLSNEKQVMLGIMQYTQDYDETLPPVWNWNQDAKAYDAMSAPYIGVGKIEWGQKSALFLCPNDDIEVKASYLEAKRRTYSMAIGTWDNGIGWNAGQYSYEGGAAAGELYQVGANSWDLLSRPRTLAEFSAPAGTLLIVENPDNNNVFGNNNGAECSSPNEQLPNPETGTKGKPYHSDGWNYGFADGHVKWMRPERTIDGNPSDSKVGTLDMPLGMWTIKDGD